MSLTGIKLGCKGCGSLTTDSIISDKNQRLYWMAANKDTLDFSILMSNLSQIYVGSLTNAFPISHQDKFDYYCTKCFFRITKGETRDG